MKLPFITCLLFIIFIKQSAELTDWTNQFHGSAAAATTTRLFLHSPPPVSRPVPCWRLMVNDGASVYFLRGGDGGGADGV